MRKEHASKLLGVGRKHSKSELRDAYLALIRKIHPDVSTEEGATERAAKLNEAYEVLLEVLTRIESFHPIVIVL